MVLPQFYFIACFWSLFFFFFFKPHKNDTAPGPCVRRRIYHAKPCTSFMAFGSLLGATANMRRSWDVWNNDSLIQRWAVLYCSCHIALSFLILLLEKWVTVSFSDHKERNHFVRPPPVQCFRVSSMFFPVAENIGSRKENSSLVRR